MKGCLLLGWSQDWKVSWFRCRSGVRTTGGSVPEPDPDRSDKLRPSGSYIDDTVTVDLATEIVSEGDAVPLVGRWPVCQCCGRSMCLVVFVGQEAPHESCETPNNMEW